MIAVIAVMGVAVCAISYIALAAVMRGWVLTYLWQWFMMPVFDIRAISIVEAVGISMIIAFLTYQESIQKDNRTTDEQIGQMIQRGIVHPLFVWGVAYIVHLFL